MERKSFVFYQDWFESLKDFDSDFVQRVIVAIVEYALYDKIPIEQDILRSPFAIIRRQIDRDNEKYQAKCLKNRENIKKRYQSHTTENKTELTNTTDNENLPKLTNVYERIRTNTTDNNCMQLKPNDNDCMQTYYDNDNDNDNDNDVSKETIILLEPKGSLSTTEAVDSRKNQEKEDFNEIVRIFNLGMRDKSIPQIQKLTDKRKSALRARIKEYGKQALLDVIRNAAESNFLNGDNNRGWKADFDWLFSPNNFPKVLEGNYDNAKQQYNPNNAASGYANASDIAAEQRDYDFRQHILNKIGGTQSGYNEAIW